ncbi:MAG: N-6 DNA methylase [Actinobacteria bacterium]|nr:N-6 DNA methylase [Actinomycetota bacterium]
MDKQQARDLIKKTFEQPFDKTRFMTFVQELLNHIEYAPFNYHGNYIPDAYRQYISSLERIGKFNGGEKRIDILIIKLQKETSLASARTMQRNFVAGYLQGKYGSSSKKEAVLVAYVAPDEADWRFSLVKMDYKFEQAPTGKMKAEEEFTSARRWSFLVGENEKSHTAQSRLVNILTNDEHNPTLAELEEAFNIESVTKEFFLKYRDLFIRTKEELDELVQNNPNIKTDFEAKSVNTVDFAKKLLGQIVFLYFLQKKGWFGVGRDDDWGTGSKQFLRELFEKKHSGYNNFFNDILEPLFYEALRIGEERKQDDYYYSRFNCKVPFLNGGLFDPIGNYDWVHTDMFLPDSLFSNFTKTKEEDTGDGILDIFDRYNFTVREDEPLEKEVAIDPELLGKTYEKFNAIRPDNFEEYKIALKSGKKGNESKFNKQYGVYYTPREIVHYMCQQSLINYLFTELNSDRISYEKLGDHNLEIFGNKGKKGQLDITIEHREKPLISKDDIEKFVHLGEQVSENEAIALIKEQRINTGIQKSTEKKLQLPESIRTNAELIDQKLTDITVCDPAVGSGAFPVGMMNEIVRARNVLSVFLNDRGRNNYEFKRQCIEHSLYGVDIDSGAVEIAKLRLWLSLLVDEENINNIKPLPNLDYKIVCGNSLLGVEKNLFNVQLFNDLEKLKPIFFNETNPAKKQEYKRQIDQLISQITNGHTEFDFEVYFSDVFHQKGGFDVVIANPPYVTTKYGKISKDLKQIYIKNFKSAYDKLDLYVLFIEKAINISKDHGIITFITPWNFLANFYSFKIRKFLLENTKIKIFNKLPPNIFGSIIVDNIISIFEKDKNNKGNQILFSDFQNKDNRKYVNQNNYFENENYVFVLPKDETALQILKKMKVNSVKLGEVALNYIGIMTGDQKKMIANKPIFKNSKPVLGGKDIAKWVYFDRGNYVNFDKTKIHSNDNEEVYLSEKKILLRKTGCELVACLDKKQFFSIQSLYNIVVKNERYIEEYLLSQLNSKLFSYIYNKFFITNPEVFPYIKRRHLDQLPVKKISLVQQKLFIDIVNKIITLSRNDDYLKNPSKQAQVKEYEKQIDQLVYQLYGLTEDEIKVVEGNAK